MATAVPAEARTLPPASQPFLDLEQANRTLEQVSQKYPATKTIYLAGTNSITRYRTIRIWWHDNDNLDKRKAVFEYLQLIGLQYTLILNGAFMDIITYMPLFDLEHQIFQYWGDGETPMNFTTTDDTAKYVAEAVSDPGLANTALEIAGDTLTPKQLKAAYEVATGTQLTEKSLGGIAEMQAWITAKKASANSLEEYVYDQYMYAMLSGKGKLDHINNDRYPHIKPKTVKQILSKENS